MQKKWSKTDLEQMREKLKVLKEKTQKSFSQLTEDKKKRIKAELDRLNKEAILKRVPNIGGIEDILGQDKEGNMPEPSKLFYVLPYVFGRLLENDPDKVISERSVKFRQKYLYQPIFDQAEKDLNGKTLIRDTMAPVPTDRRVIFSPNHGFLEDAALAFIMAETPLYYIFGSLPAFFNSVYGVATYLIGAALVNRKDSSSRNASIEKANKLIEYGSNIILFPEGTHNRSPHNLLTKYWKGVYRVSKNTGAVVVPMAFVYDILEGDKIYASRLPYIELSKYDESQVTEALDELRAATTTELWRLMEKYTKMSYDDIIKNYLLSVGMTEEEINKLIEDNPELTFREAIMESPVVSKTQELAKVMDDSASATRDEFLMTVLKKQGITEDDISRIMSENEGVSRSEVINTLMPMSVAEDYLITEQVGEVGKYYDAKAEEQASYYPKNIAEYDDVWDPIINACGVPKENNEIQKMKLINYQRRY